MIWLVLGVVLWSGLHLIPAIGTSLRAACIARLGEGPYKGLFALSLVAAIVLMVMGWRSTPPAAVYAPVLANGVISYAMIFIALLLFLASGVPTNIKRKILNMSLASALVVLAAGVGVLIGGRDAAPRSAPIPVPFNPSDTVIHREDPPFRPIPAPPTSEGWQPR